MEATYAARKGYPLLLTLNAIIRGVREGGLHMKWSNDLEKIMFSSFEENDKVVLTLDHLQAAFFLLILGLTLALIIFMVEYSVDWYNVTFASWTEDGAIKLYNFVCFSHKMQK